MNKGKSTEQIIQKAKKVDEWRLLSVEERLKHALIKGNIDFIDKDTEEARVKLGKPLLVIEGNLIKASL